MSNPRLAELGTQRDPPPYFAGRGAELAALRKRLRRLCETGDPRSGMSLVIGVPRVGKTQLGREFAEQAVACEAPAKVRRSGDLCALASPIGTHPLGVARATPPSRPPA